MITSVCLSTLRGRDWTTPRSAQGTKCQISYQDGFYARQVLVSSVLSFLSPKCSRTMVRTGVIMKQQIAFDQVNHLFHTVSPTTLSSAYLEYYHFKTLVQMVTFHTSMIKKDI